MARVLILCVAGGLYVLSPIDFAPDFFPVIGWLDDIGVLAYVVKSYKDFRQTVDAQQHQITTGN